MNLVPYTYNGTAINSGNFTAKFALRPLATTARPRFVASGNARAPFLSGKELQGTTIDILFSCSGATLGDDFATLTALFDTADKTKRKLIAKDADDSSRQWYVYGFPTAISSPDGRVLTVTLALDSPVWLTEAVTTESTWAITATGQQKTVAVSIGNLSAYPVISISPSAARGVGFAYKRFVTTYNRTTVTASYYNMDITAGGLDTSALVIDTTKSNQINSGPGITDSATTIPIDTSVGGGLPTSGMGWIVDGTDSEQISWGGNSGGNLTSVTRGIGGTTAKAHADNKVIALSHMLANGGDIRVRVGTTEGNMTDNPFWLSTTALSAATALKIWTPITYEPRTICTLSASMTNSQTTLTHAYISPAPNYPTGGGTLLVETEKMTYTSYDPVLRKFSGLVRGAFNTTAATHAAGLTVNLIPVIMMYYGDPTLTMPAYNTQYKPVFSLSSSTNSQWVFDDFRVVDNDAVRSSSWKYKVKNTDLVDIYDTTQTIGSGLGDTSAAMGVSLQNPYMTGYWYLSVPFGFTSAVFGTISRYNVSTNTSGIRYAQIRSYVSSPTVYSRTDIAATTLANTWQTTTSLTHTVPASGVHKYLQFYLYNSSATAFTNPSAIDVRDVDVNLSTSTTSSSYGVPFAALGAEVAIEYSADLTLQNTATAKSIYLKTEIPFGQSIEIDTLNKTVTRKWDNRSAFPDFGLSDIRDEWLALIQGNNVLQYDETGASGIDVVITYQGRNN